MTCSYHLCTTTGTEARTFDGEPVHLCTTHAATFDRSVAAAAAAAPFAAEARAEQAHEGRVS